MDSFRCIKELNVRNEQFFEKYLIINNIEFILAENYIYPFVAVGEIFVPQLHEAVSMVEDSTLDDGTITQEVSKGYISGKAILKPVSYTHLTLPTNREV